MCILRCTAQQTPVSLSACWPLAAGAARRVPPPGPPARPRAGAPPLPRYRGAMRAPLPAETAGSPARMPPPPAAALWAAAWPAADGVGHRWCGPGAHGPGLASARQARCRRRVARAGPRGSARARRGPLRCSAGPCGRICRALRGPAGRARAAPLRGRFAALARPQAPRRPISRGKVPRSRWAPV